MASGPIGKLFGLDATGYGSFYNQSPNLIYVKILVWEKNFFQYLHNTGRLDLKIFG